MMQAILIISMCVYITTLPPTPALLSLGLIALVMWGC